MGAWISPSRTCAATPNGVRSIPSGAAKTTATVGSRSFLAKGLQETRFPYPRKWLSSGSASPRVATGESPRFMTVGDFNGDCFPDLAVSNLGAPGGRGSISVLLNNCDGSFSFSRPLGLDGNARGIVSADFNRDTHLDLAGHRQRQLQRERHDIAQRPAGRLSRRLASCHGGFAL